MQKAEKSTLWNNSKRADQTAFGKNRIYAEIVSGNKHATATNSNKKEKIALKMGTNKPFKSKENTDT